MLSGSQWGWGAPIQLLCLAASAVCGILFVLRERRIDDPMIDLSIFHNGFFSISIVCVLLVFVVSFCVIIVQLFTSRTPSGFRPQRRPPPARFAPCERPRGSLERHFSDKLGAKALTVAGLAIMLAGFAS